MSEPIKYTYRTVGGVIVLFFLGVVGLIGIIFTLLGLVIITLISWQPLTDPNFLIAVRIFFLGNRITDPMYASFLFLFSGLTLFIVGIITFGFIFYVTNLFLLLEGDLTEIVEKNVPSIKIFISPKAKAIYVLSILLFSTFIVFFLIFL